MHAQIRRLYPTVIHIINYMHVQNNEKIPVLQVTVFSPLTGTMDWTGCKLIFPSILLVGSFDLQKPSPV